MVVIAAVIRFSWQRVERALCNALLCAAVLISTHNALDYDHVVLLPALGWLWLDGRKHGFLPWDKSLMAFVRVAPIFARQAAELAFLPLGCWRQWPW